MCRTKLASEPSVIGARLALIGQLGANWVNFLTSKRKEIETSEDHQNVRLSILNNFYLKHFSLRPSGNEIIDLIG